MKSQTVLLPLSVGMEKIMGCPAVSKSLLIWFECSSPDQKPIIHVCVCITIDPNFRAVPLNGFCLFGDRLGLTFPAVPVRSVPETSSTPAVTTSPQSTMPLALALLTALGFFLHTAP